MSVPGRLDGFESTEFDLMASYLIGYLLWILRGLQMAVLEVVLLPLRLFWAAVWFLLSHGWALAIAVATCTSLVVIIRHRARSSSSSVGLSTQADMSCGCFRGKNRNCIPILIRIIFFGVKN